MYIPIVRQNFINHQNISLFLEKNSLWLQGLSKQETKENYLQLTHLVSTVKKNPFILKNLSKDEIKTLFTNPHYRLVGLTNDIANILLEKKEYSAFEKVFLKSFNWMEPKNFIKIFAICMNNFSYSDEELEKIHQNFKTYHHKFNLMPDNEKLNKTVKFSNPALIKLFKKLMLHSIKPNERELFYRDVMLERITKHIWSAIFQSDDQTIEEAIKIIPTLSPDMTNFLMKNNCHIFDMNLDFNNNLFEDNITEKFYNRFANPEIIKKLYSTLVKHWEKNIDNLETKNPTNLQFSLVEVLNRDLHQAFSNNNIQIPLAFEHASEKAKVYIAMKMMYYYCDQHHEYYTNNSSSVRCAFFPAKCQINILKNIPFQNWNDILKKSFHLQMPEENIKFSNILLSFAFPDNFKLSSNHVNGLLMFISSILDKKQKHLDRISQAFSELNKGLFDSPDIKVDTFEKQYIVSKVMEIHLNNCIPEKNTIAKRPKKF